MSAHLIIGPLPKLRLAHHSYKQYWLLCYPLVSSAEGLFVLPRSMHSFVGALAMTHSEDDWAELDLALLHLLAGYSSLREVVIPLVSNILANH